MSKLVAEFFPVRVTEKTVWLFVSLSDGQLTGWGEATLGGQEQAMESLFNNLPYPLSTEDFQSLAFDTLPEAALSSALLQARADLLARRDNKVLSESLGGILQSRIGVYANINRRTKDRSAAGMAMCTKNALRAGHNAIKIAPFDEVCPDMNADEMFRAMEVGLRRISAVRDAIGERRLMVDCHWRFNFNGAQALIDACSPFSLYWIECPIAETIETIPSLKRLRSHANNLGLRLAGLETQIRRQGFRPYLEAGSHDVMMPDIKYCGGPKEMIALATDFETYGVDLSPHNPSGPICHLHSMHVCAALPKTDLLEMQFDETPFFNSLSGQMMPPVTDGRIALTENHPGLGISLILSELES